VAKWDRFEQTQTGLELGWTKSDSRRKIWGLSHTHLANAIDQFSSWLEPVDDSPVREATAALTGFAWLAELEERIELTQPLAAACADFVTGLTEGDQERTIRGYSAVETIVSRIRARFGYDLGRSWNKQGIDEEFDHLVEASALLVDRLKHENLTDTDTRNTYDLAVKIAHGWKRLVNGSYFLLYSEPYSEAAAAIISAMDEHDSQRVHAGVEQIVELGIRLAGASTTFVEGAQPKKGDLVEVRDAVPGGRYVAAADARAVEGHPNRWSVEAVLSDPRVAGPLRRDNSSDVGAERRERA
jgi:hypothetical protein